MKLLKIENLIINDHLDKILVNNISLDIYKGKMNVLIGESGAGKSLTARALLKFLPKGLSMSLDKYEFDDNNYPNMHYLLGKEIGYISQNYAHSFNEHTRIEKQLIAIYQTHYDVSQAEALEKIITALSWVNMNDFNIIKKYSFQLSGGQLERVYIASVLMLNPKFIIADEPVASLDVINGHKIMQLFQYIVKNQHKTMLLITHNMNHVLKYGDYFNVMKDGELIEKGELNNLLEYHILHPYTQKLLDNKNTLIHKGRHI